MDLCGGEHTEYSREVKFVANQPQTSIGNKQTSKMQATDIRYARIGKVRQNLSKPRFRTAVREASHRVGKAAQMLLKMRLKLEMMIDMHAACVEDNQAEQGVVKALRMGGCLAFRPTKEGLLPLDGPVWDQFPLGSSRLGSAVVQRREEGVQDGKPRKPDWDQLRHLRDRQNWEALRGHYAGQLQACKSQSQRDILEAELKEKWEAEDGVPVRGFLDLTFGGFGEPVFADQEEAERIVCDELFSLRDFEGGDAAILQQLHPRQRKRLLDEAFLQAAGEKKRRRLNGHEAQQIEQLQGQVGGLTAEEEATTEAQKRMKESRIRFRQRRQELRDLIKDTGLEPVRRGVGGVR